MVALIMIIFQVAIVYLGDDNNDYAYKDKLILSVISHIHILT